MLYQSVISRAWRRNPPLGTTLPSKIVTPITETPILTHRPRKRFGWDVLFAAGHRPTALIGDRFQAVLPPSIVMTVPVTVAASDDRR
jgi:hypothetical protein